MLLPWYHWELFKPSSMCVHNGSGRGEYVTAYAWRPKTTPWCQLSPSSHTRVPEADLGPADLLFTRHLTASPAQTQLSPERLCLAFSHTFSPS